MIELLIGIVVGAGTATIAVRRYWPRIERKELVVDTRLQHKFAVVFQTDAGARARDAITNAKPREGELFEFFEGSVRRQLKDGSQSSGV